MTAIKTWKVKLVNGKHLPLQLRSGSMDSGRNQHVMPSSPGSRPTLEDFMPFKRRWEQRDQPSESSDVEEEVRGSKRPAWLTEAPLWRQSSGCSEVFLKSFPVIAKQGCGIANRLKFLCK